MSHIFCLGGGGSNGAYQAGIMEGLYRIGIQADMLVGISVGALNALLFSALRPLKTDAAVTVWRTLVHKDTVIKKPLKLSNALWSLVRKKDHVLDAQPLWDLMQRLFPTEYIHLSVPIEVGYIDMSDGTYHTRYFPAGNNDKEEVLKAVYWSAAFPLMFEPKNNMWDGGLRNNVPLKDCVKHNPDKITIITCSPLSEKLIMTPEKDRNLPKAVKDVLSILMNEIARNDVNQFLLINEFIRRIPERFIEFKGKIYKYFDAKVYAPAADLGDALDFSNKKANALFTKGLAVVKNDNDVS